MAKKIHVHKYYRTTLTPERGRHGKIKGKKIWRCGVPSCTHYVFDKHLVVGRQSVCWACGEVFILTNPALRRAKPTCGCKLKENKDVLNVLDILTRMDIPLEQGREEVSSEVHEMPEIVPRDIANNPEQFAKLKTLLEEAERNSRLDPD